MNTYRYSATVNGEHRAVIFQADPEEWGHEPITEDDGTVTPAELNLATADLIIHNERRAYDEFYAHAEYADYDAEHVEPRLERMHPATWEVVE